MKLHNLRDLATYLLRFVAKPQVLIQLHQPRASPSDGRLGLAALRASEVTRQNASLLQNAGHLDARMSQSAARHRRLLLAEPTSLQDNALGVRTDHQAPVDRKKMIKVRRPLVQFKLCMV